MLTLKNKTVTKENDGACTHTRYEAEGYAMCDGSSIWEYEGDLKVAVTAIDIFEEDYLGDGDISTMIYVEHNTDWRIYTDRGFEDSISKALGFDVMFTEQGMQEDGCASMEI
jgi:hypothetical protein